MKIIHKISDKKFTPFNGNKTYIASNRNTILTLADLSIVYETNLKCRLQFESEDYIVLSGMLQNSPPIAGWFRILKENHIEEPFYKYELKEDLEIGLKSYFHPGYLLFDNHSNNTISLKDMKLKTLWGLEDINIHYVYRQENKLVIVQGNPNNILKCLDFNTGKVLWELDVSGIGPTYDHRGKQKGKIQGNGIHVFENIIVVPLVMWGLIGVDFQTGKVLWTLDDKQKWVPFKYDNFLYGVGEVVYEIDSKTGEFLRSKKIDEILDRSNERVRDSLIAIQGISVSEKYIIFGNKGLVYILDRATFNLIETLEIDCTIGVYTGPPLYKDGYLYIIDCDQYLHVIKDESAFALQ